MHTVTILPSIVLTFVTAWGVSGNHIQQSRTTDMDVVVSRGAIITPLPDVLVYTEMESIFFLTPDIPEAPSLTSSDCSDRVDERFCAIHKEMVGGMADVTNLLKVIKRVLTTRGLGEEKITSEVIDPKWFDKLDFTRVQSQYPSDALKSAAGEDYLSDLEMRLALRKLIQDGPSSLNLRQRRWIASVLKPAVKIVGKLASGVDIAKIFESLFIGDNGILTALAGYRAASPDDRKAFSELSDHVSEFQTETRKLLVDVLKRTDRVEELTEKLQTEQYEYGISINGFKDSLLMHGTLLSDIIRYLYATNVYAMHFEAYQECRANKVSPIFIPPALLKNKLEILEKAMPSNLVLSIPSEQVHRYFRISTAVCLYDSDGGVVKVDVPLTSKEATYQLYEYKPIQYAFHEYTCMLDTPASYVVKDVYTNNVWPVGELDADACLPHTGLCKLPISVNMDPASVCIETLLHGSSAEVIRSSCPFKCFRQTLSVITKVTSNEYIGVHLPKSSVSIECPQETVTLTETVDYGSVMFNVPCGCKLMWDQRVVAQPSSVPCNKKIRPSLSVLVPVQFTTLYDLKPFTDNGEDRAVYTHVEEILNDDFDPLFGSEETEVPLAVPIVGFIWNFFHSLMLMYMFFRNHYVHGAALAAVANNIPMVRAASDHTCKLPMEAYILLYSILCVAIMSLIPGLFSKIWEFISRQWNGAVDLEAARRIQNERAF